VPEGVKSIRPCYISGYGFEEVSAGMPFWQIGMKNNVAAEVVRVWFGFGGVVFGVEFCSFGFGLHNTIKGCREFRI